MLTAAVSLLFCAACPAQNSVVKVGSSVIPEETARYVEVGELCAAKRDYKGAVTAFREAVKRSPDVPELHVNLAGVLIRTGDYAGVVEECNKAIALRPNDPMAWSGIGPAYQMLGQNAKAIAAYKKFIELAPKDPNRPRYEQAIKELEADLKSGKPQADSDPNNYLAEVTFDGVHCWSKSKMPLKVYIANGAGLAGYRPEFSEIMKKSFNEWAAASNGKVSIVFVPNKKDSDISCGWSNDRSKFVLSDEAGQSIQTTTDEGVLHADITIPCVPQDPAGDPITPEAMHGTCLHEIGHALGMHGHSLHPEDMMFASDVSFRKSAAALTKRDAATIQALYELKFVDSKPKAKAP